MRGKKTERVNPKPVPKEKPPRQVFTETYPMSVYVDDVTLNADAVVPFHRMMFSRDGIFKDCYVRIDDATTLPLYLSVHTFEGEVLAETKCIIGINRVPDTDIVAWDRYLLVFSIMPQHPDTKLEEDQSNTGCVVSGIWIAGELFVPSRANKGRGPEE